MVVGGWRMADGGWRAADESEPSRASSGAWISSRGDTDATGQGEREKREDRWGDAEDEKQKTWAWPAWGGGEWEWRVEFEWWRSAMGQGPSHPPHRIHSHPDSRPKKEQTSVPKAVPWPIVHVSAALSLTEQHRRLPVAASQTDVVAGGRMSSSCG